MPGSVPAWVRHHPIWFATGMTLLWHLLLFTAVEVVPPVSSGLRYIAINVTAAVLPLAVIGWWGWWRGAALGWRSPDRTWLLILPLLAVSLSYLADGIEGTVSALLSSAVLCVAVAVSEELLSRGAVQHALTGLGPVRASVLVALLFGAGHILSRLWFGSDVGEAVWVGFSAATFGFVLATVRWHVQTLWPLIGLHAVEDFTQLNSPENLPFHIRLAYCAGYIAYGWLLLNRLSAEQRAARTTQL